MDNKNIDLGELFEGLQEQMVVQLNTNREFITHSTTKGDSIENVWIEWLREYLPNRYSVDKAIVVDSEGKLSDQIDLVIYDQQYTPFVFTQNGIHYVPAEGVYAVFEVKPDLKGSLTSKGKSLSYIEYAGKKIESVRKLTRTSTSIVDRGEKKDSRALTKIVGGILTIVNTYKHKRTVENHLKNLQGLNTIDMGCAIDSGGFYVDYSGKEDSSIFEKNERIKEYYKSRSFESLRISSKKRSLVVFFLQLSRYLQQSIGTVAAIDFNAYAQAINFKIDEEI